MGRSERLLDYDFELPEPHIARYPLEARSQSRLMRLCRKSGFKTHHQFSDLVHLLVPGDLLVLNNTRVIPARLYGHKETGGKVEVLIERIVSSEQALAQLKTNKTIQIPSHILVGTFSILVQRKDNGLYRLQLENNAEWFQVLEQMGKIPLPPYLRRETEPLDVFRYQTVYATVAGAVAAPTAGLHFDESLLEQLVRRGVEIATITLHIGAGTFQPIRMQHFKNHILHAEWIHQDATACQKINLAKQEKRRVIAVGTTTVRCLESVANAAGLVSPYTGETRLFITPGYRFKCVDAMITNFHLPQSSLLLLVCAFGGRTNILSAYQEAVRMGYRFYSYGDAMLIDHEI